MSSLATDNTSENKLLRFHDTGGYNAQQYRYADDGTLEGDEGEQWIEFIGNLMRPPNSHGEPEHIHVPAQTAYKWHRIPYNENDQDDAGVDIARYTDREAFVIPACKLFKDNPNPNPVPEGMDPWDYLPVYDPDNPTTPETYDLDWTKIEGPESGQDAPDACKTFFSYPYGYENKYRELDETPQPVEPEAGAKMDMDDLPHFRKLPLRF
tara:strand:- start:11941 stop:12567 length:627 start_codon:yes stop_codon:yes gene_type:complete